MSRYLIQIDRTQCPLIEEGIKTAKKRGAVTIGLLGGNGGTIKDVVDIPIVVESTNTARIQEVHRVIYHIICGIVEKDFE